MFGKLKLKSIVKIITSDDALESMKRELPGTVVGYSEELKERYQIDRAWFSQNWDAIRNTES